MSQAHKQSARGGSRLGAGRPKGRSKTKICVSVNQTIWQSAVSIWNGSASHLVEKSLSEYVAKRSDNTHSAAI